MALVTVWFLCTPNHHHLDRNLPPRIARMSESHFSESNSSQDNELQFLTDTAFSFLFDDASSHSISKSKWGADGLFMERLESFIEGQLKDIENFANREQVPLDEVVYFVGKCFFSRLIGIFLDTKISCDTTCEIYAVPGFDFPTYE